MMCSGCVEEDARMLCGGCERVGYCTEECRESDWSSGHHSECIQSFLSAKKNKKKKAAEAAAEPQRKHESQVEMETCTLARDRKVSFASDVEAFEHIIINASSTTKGAVQRLVYGNTLEADLILNQVASAHHGACSEDLVRSLRISFGNDQALNAPFAWANLDETAKEVTARTGPTRRLKTQRISHGAAAQAALGLVTSLTGAAEVFKVELSPTTILDFKAALSSSSSSSSSAIKGRIFLRARVRVRVKSRMREFLLKGQMTKLPRKGSWWLWVIEGRAVEAEGEFIRFKDDPVRAALVLKARVETDGTTISLPVLYFIAAAL